MKKFLNAARALVSKTRQHAFALAAAGTAGAMTLPNPARAALALDTAEILADIAICVGFITTVGLAVLGMIYVAKALKWARKAG